MALAILLVLFLIPNLFEPVLNSKLSYGRTDFAPPYAASQVMQTKENKDLYSHHVTWQVEKIRPEKDGGGLRYLYPPSYAVLFIPLTWFEFNTATRIWILLNLLMLFGSCYLILKILKANTLDGWVIILVIFIYFFPIYKALASGETNILILFFIVLAIYLFLAKKNFSAGLALGMATIVKIFPIILLPYFLWRKKYKLAAGVAVFLITVTLISICYGNLDMEKKYYGKVLPDLITNGINMNLATGHSKTLTGFLMRNFTTTVEFTPIIVLPQIAIQIIRYLITFSLLAIGAYLIIRRKKRDKRDYLLEISYIITFGLIAATYIQDQYSIWLLIPILLLLFGLSSFAKKWDTALLTFGIILVGVRPEIVLYPKILYQVAGGGIIVSAGFIGTMIILYLLAKFSYNYLSVLKKPTIKLIAKK